MKRSYKKSKSYKLSNVQNNADCDHPLTMHSILSATPFCDNINYGKGQTVKLPQKL